MSKSFKDAYIKTVHKNTDVAIAENPILALTNGVPDDRVRQALKDADWPETEIEELINKVKQSKE
jgi:hypothetical protein